MSWHEHPLALDQPPAVFYVGRTRWTDGAPTQFRLQGGWQIHLYEDPVSIRLDGQHVEMDAGSVSLIPPETPSIYNWGDGVRASCLHFEPMPGRTGDTLRILPVHQTEAQGEPGRNRRLRDLVRWFDSDPVRVRARLWDLLLSISTPAVRERPDPIETVLNAIEENLSDPPSVPELASRADMSDRHLLRHFQERFNTSVVGYCRQRRMSRARLLLLGSSLPIKAVAHHVGLGDLQRFNKAVRREFGLSPRELREQSHESAKPSADTITATSPISPSKGRR